jgi:hypothetical protein
VWAALALVDRAPITIVGAGDPVSSLDDHALWWHAIDSFAAEDQLVVLCVLPPARALPSNMARRVVDVTPAALQLGGVQ